MILLVLFLAMLSIGSWLAYLWIHFGKLISTKSSAEDVIALSYKDICQSRIMDSDHQNHQTKRVLLLGGSVLEQGARELEAELARRCTAPVTVYRLVHAAHTSRDSLIKWECVSGKKFDVVCLYHVANDIRMNCVPEGEFREDYSHCGWYAELDRRRHTGRIGITEATSIAARQVVRRISIGKPDVKNLKYGADIRTPIPFGNNIEKIVREALASGAFVVIGTAPVHVVEDYSREAFLDKKLDYGVGQYRMPADDWGLPENFKKTSRLHNEQIRQIVERNACERLRFVDLEKTFPQDGEHFCDVCHLTTAGVRELLTQLLSVWPINETCSDPNQQ